MAAAAISAAARRAGLDVEVDSAGTGSWHLGSPPHPQAARAAARAGLEVTGKARRFGASDFDRFDVIVAMDRSNLHDILELAPSLEARARVRLFRSYDPGSEEDEVPDPYGGPDEGYDRTAAIVLAAANGMVDTLSSARIEDAIALD
jgi:protein-tyrosine phosphatase